MHKTINLLCRCLVLVALSIPSVTIAANEKPIDCAVEKYDGKLFVGLYKNTEKAAKDFCQAFMRSRLDQAAVDNAQVGFILQDFAGLYPCNDRGKMQHRGFHVAKKDPA